MIASPSAARVLVASDSVSDADQVLRLLEIHFPHVLASTSPELAVRDYETHKPDVLVLAFDGIAKAQSYYLGLYRIGQIMQRHLHRTVLLCSKDELPEAFELCKKQYFDDYVLYWPFAHDGLRLPMSIWIAAREMMALNGQPSPPQPSPPQAAEQSVRTQHLAEPEAALSPAATGGERRLLMVVDDDELTVDLLSGALREQAYDVVSVGDGASALRELQRVRPDVIFMDVGLPGLDGVSLTRQLKSLPRLASIPIIMMTGDSRRLIVTSSVEAGAADFVIKPFTRDALLTKLRKVLKD